MGERTGLIAGINFDSTPSDSAYIKLEEAKKYLSRGKHNYSPNEVTIATRKAEEKKSLIKRRSMGETPYSLILNSSIEAVIAGLLNDR